MSLDDRSLREQLDRRAGSGSAEPSRIADAVISRLEHDSSPWRVRWPLGMPRLTFAAAALVVALVAVAVLPSALHAPGPGSSPTGLSPSGPTGSGYPVADALDAAGLAALLGDYPEIRASIVVIADVQLISIRRLCSSDPCGSDLGIIIPGTDRFIPVTVAPDLRGAPSPYAFRVVTDGSLEMLGPVRPGPSSLAWGFDQLTDQLEAIRTEDAAWRQLYLVDARLSIDPGVRYCALSIPPRPSPFFGCDGLVAWLMPLDASYPPPEPPADGLRVPNVAGVRERSDAYFEAGLFLIDPTASVHDCFLCGPLGAADLLGRVLPPDELGDPGPATGKP